MVDFSIYYDEGTGSGTWVLLEPGVIEYQAGSGTQTYVLLDSNIATAHYTTHNIAMQPGTTYSFKVTARNTVGSGL